MPLPVFVALPRLAPEYFHSDGSNRTFTDRFGLNYSPTAPKAQLVPLRVTDSVVLLLFSKLVRSIRFAADNALHVISISLGGPFGSNFLTHAVPRRRSGSNCTRGVRQFCSAAICGVCRSDSRSRYSQPATADSESGDRSGVCQMLDVSQQQLDKSSTKLAPKSNIASPQAPCSVNSW